MGLLAVFLLLLPFSFGQQQWPTLSGNRPLIFGHRGDPYFAPAHSLMSYSIAIDEGVDYVEPDLVQTADGEIICLHDLFLSDSTSIADDPWFAGRNRTLTIDGSTHSVNDWFASDFTLSELRRLRLTHYRSKPQRSPVLDLALGVLTFSEMLDFVNERSALLGKAIGVVPELKHPGYFRALNSASGRGEFYFEDRVMSILRAKGYLADATGVAPHGPLMIQCAESDTLKYLRSLDRFVPLLQLVFEPPAMEGYTGVFQDWYLSEQGMKETSQYASALGIPKETLAVDPAKLWSTALSKAKPGQRKSGAEYQTLVPAASVVSAAHRYGLQVILYTFRAPREEPSPLLSYVSAFGMGADAVFAEHSARALVGLDQAQSNLQPTVVPGGKPSTDWRVNVAIVATVLIVVVLVITGVVVYCKRKKAAAAAVVAAAARNHHHHHHSGESELQQPLTDVSMMSPYMVAASSSSSSSSSPSIGMLDAR